MIPQAPHNLDVWMVTPARFERATYGLGIRCSILLSYGAGQTV